METVIIGLPSSGKTTIFNALTGRSAPTGDSSAPGRQVHRAEVPVPDARIDRLAELYRPRKTTYATVLFRDPPLTRLENDSLAPAGLGEARKADAMTVVIRAFADESVHHPLKAVNPLRDLRAVLDSLVLADQEVAERRLVRLAKEARRDGREHKLLRRAVDRLAEGRLLGRTFFAAEDEKLFAGFGFLTAKPIVAVLNDGERAADHAAVEVEARERGIAVFCLRGDLEAEIAELDASEQTEFLRDLGASEPAKSRFLRHVYAHLDLVSFLTAGEPEVRAWSVLRGTTAARGAGTIHSDLEKGFIRAEVAWWEDLLACGGWRGARKANKVRLEGRDYVLEDGDAILVRFNV
jgi:GTP-binding protein YchF